MAKLSIGIPRGTRDFLPHEMLKRNYIFKVIRSVFEQYGYSPIETPAMENLSTLMGKYGEEGDRLLFKILNSGDFTQNVDFELNVNKLAAQICEKGLRYDLTVPFARFVVQHREELTFPFKRYQIQPVWRADRPQKGRYREFFQCDADVIGSNALLNEVEFVLMIDSVFDRLKMDVDILINNRKILSGIAQYIDCQDKIIDITVAIDKLDKIGLEKVNEELASKGIPSTAIDRLQPIILLEGSNQEKLEKLSKLMVNSEIGKQGIEESKAIFEYLQQEGVCPKSKVTLDLTLARGLNYYTGTIFEVKSTQMAMGSICGGGRYDNLTGIFGLDNLSGVGISFGIERIYDIWSELNKEQTLNASTTQVLFANFGKKEEMYCLKALVELRKCGINAELYPEAAKIQKQLKYADNKQIPFVIFAGEEEIRQEKFTVKNMLERSQSLLTIEQLKELFH